MSTVYKSTTEFCLFSYSALHHVLYIILRRCINQLVQETKSNIYYLPTILIDQRQRRKLDS